MKKAKLMASIFVAFLLLQFSISFTSFSEVHAQSNPDVYVGVDIAYGAVADAKAAIDRVGSFTNFVVIGSTQVTWFQQRVNETFQYAYDKGLSIVSLRPSLPQYSTIDLNETEWYPMAQSRWGDRLLGFYVMDEPGGRQLDGTQTYTWNNQTGQPSSYNEAASMFTNGISRFLSYQRSPPNYKTFTSDYALYWYDYKAGHDTVWTELGGNYSQQINIALCRAAAAANNKDWGAIITWSYSNYPWIENGTQLYDDMLLAYDNGAKYIVVFDSNENGGSILQQEHLDAMQRFWNYAQNNQPKSNYPKSERTAFVLPNAYGFGFRWPTDHIWGIWQPDALTSNITLSVGTLLNQYGEKLDIVYDDDLKTGNNGYNQLIYWNSYDPNPTPSPSPSPSPTASLTPSPTPNNNPKEAFSTTVVATAVLFGVVIGTGLFVYKNKRKPKAE
jgi:hypothetical protein